MSEETFWVDLEPVDALFFRDHRPMRAGVDNRTVSVPPSSLTLFGSLGTWLIEGMDTTVAEYAEGKSPNAEKITSRLGPFDPELKKVEWRIAGPFYGDSEGGYVYFPAPACLYYDSKSLDEYHRKLVPSEQAPSGRTNIQDGLRPLVFEGGAQQAEDFDPVEGWVSNDDLGTLLCGSVSEDMEYRSEEKFTCTEERYGIRLSPDTFSTEEGLFYSTRRLRFKRSWDGRNLHETRFSVQVRCTPESVENGGGQSLFEKILHEKGGIGFFGGERGRVNLSIRQRSPSIKAPEAKVLAKAKRFFLYLATPALFEEGWRPGQWPAPIEEAQLVSVALRKPGWISGWTKGAPRPLRRAVRAGTVYYFEAPNWDEGRFQTLIERVHFNQSISDYYPCAGFGITCIGVW